MKKWIFTLLVFSYCSKKYTYGQATLVDVESRIFESSQHISIQGEIGFLEVPENRNNPASRKIRIKYARLRSLAQKPLHPVVYLEGGGGKVIWQTENPKELDYWLDILEISDLIFVERRGTDDESLLHIWDGEFPKNFFETEKKAYAHYSKMVKAALRTFDQRGIDVTGYNIEEHAKDLKDLLDALKINRYSLYGFSYGSHIGMTLMKLFPKNIDRAILSGSDAPNQALNYPRYLDNHVDTLAKMVSDDKELSKSIPDLKALIVKVMEKLAQNPAQVDIKNPITGEVFEMGIGPFGLALILRLDIDDSTDIPIIPRLLYSIKNDDYSLLQWFAQKRIVFALAISGQGINQQLASGASEKRWHEIQKQAKKSIFGNVVNFPFSAAKADWVTNSLSFNPSEPLVTNIPTLFVTGTLDCRTPVDQVEQTMKGFSNAIHVKVENAGHEQVLWDKEVKEDIVPRFLMNEKIENTQLFYSEINFIKLKGEALGHPALE